MSDSSTKQGFAYGGVLLAGTMLILAGLWQAFMGLVGVVNDDFYVATRKWVLTLDTTTWGWVNMAIGLALFAVGVLVIKGAMWARVLAMAVAIASALSNFFFLPYYPLWAILIIAVDVFAVWALAVWDAERSDAR